MSDQASLVRVFTRTTSYVRRRTSTQREGKDEVVQARQGLQGLQFHLDFLPRLQLTLQIDCEMIR